MQICSPCFRDIRSAKELDEAVAGSQGKSRRRKFKADDSKAKFYCCGRVPPEGFYRKRHGMFDVEDVKSDSTKFTESNIELAIDAFEYADSGVTKSVNPKVPFTEDLPEELYQGRVIEVQGKLLENARRFSINLSTGKNNNADLAMHFNPRFDRRVIVRNHRLKNKWGVEEIVSAQQFPFTIGRNFSVLIFVADEQFLVSINKIHYCAFTFRIPIERIRSLLILGDIQLSVVQHYDMISYPPQILKKVPTVLLPHNMRIENIKCDIRRKIKAIGIGSKVDIFGRLKLLPRAFYINLQKGTSLWPHPTIPFHMNLRLHAPGTYKREKEIIFNSWSNGSWGKEQIITYCPFLPGTAFQITITCKAECFNVMVNNVVLLNFSRNTIDSEINSVVIHGDVLINKVILH